METALLTDRGSGRAHPPFLSVLAERFEPEVIDLPEGGARIRLVVERDGEWDALVSANGMRLVGAEETRADAVLIADERTWGRIARDVRGGMEAFRARRLRVRQNLHLGVGWSSPASTDTLD